MPMPSFGKPSVETMRAFLASQANLGFTYSAVGVTATTPPAGYNVDHTRMKLGEGEKVFLVAKSALAARAQFSMTWMETWCPEETPRKGSMVAIVGQSLGLWWLNACRVAYILDEDGPVKRFSLALGTLPAHLGSGEERFRIEWNLTDDNVSYDILAFSRPHGLIARMGYPWFRRVQSRFRRDSVAAMLRAVSGQG